MARIRTFIAVDFGSDIRDRLVSLQNFLAQTGADVNWVAPENLHVTLLFLGEVDEREVLDVCKAVSGVTEAVPSFPVSVGGVGCFPNARRPRTLWVGLTQGAKEMAGLHDALEEPLLKLRCYRRENREFTPHITLGRVRSGRALAGLSAGMDKRSAWSAGDATVAEVHVMSSVLTPDGPNYTILSRARLAATR